MGALVQFILFAACCCYCGKWNDDAIGSTYCNCDPKDRDVENPEPICTGPWWHQIRKYSYNCWCSPGDSKENKNIHTE